MRGRTGRGGAERAGPRAQGGDPPARRSPARHHATEGGAPPEADAPRTPRPDDGARGGPYLAVRFADAGALPAALAAPFAGTGAASGAGASKAGMASRSTSSNSTRGALSPTWFFA